MKIRCPACREWTRWEDNPNRPFCSTDCRNRDLGNWATEKYRIAEEEGDKREERKDPPEAEDD